MENQTSFLNELRGISQNRYIEKKLNDFAEECIQNLIKNLHAEIKAGIREKVLKGEWTEKEGRKVIAGHTCRYHNSNYEKALPSFLQNTINEKDIKAFNEEKKDIEIYGRDRFSDPYGLRIKFCATYKLEPIEQYSRFLFFKYKKRKRIIKPYIDGLTKKIFSEVQVLAKKDGIKLLIGCTPSISGTRVETIQFDRAFEITDKGIQEHSGVKEIYKDDYDGYGWTNKMSLCKALERLAKRDKRYLTLPIYINYEMQL